MQGSKSKVDWDAVQRDRHEGMSVRELSEKYGVSDASIYTRTRGNGIARRAKPASSGANGNSNTASAAIVGSPSPSLPESLRSAIEVAPIEKQLAAEVADAMQKALPLLRIFGYEIVKRGQAAA